ncbi:MAG: 2-oxoacid:acceptor oxidoreductase subunit alpha [Desulfurococcales archaeon]|nr:2-oxoacid:acceptor oxidoreductase subunit alpha [Desulfurococcales archaeon]
MVDLAIIIGGPQGGGIESAGQIGVRALAMKGYDIYGVREYHSNIIGAHSYFNIRVRDAPARSARLPVDAVVALDAESVFTHMDDVREGGVFVYDTSTLKTKIDRIAPMPQPLKERVKAKLASMGLGDTVSDAIKYLEGRSVKLIGINLKAAIKEVAEKSGRPVVSVARAANVVGLSAALAYLGVEEDYVKAAIEAYFAGRPKIIEPNKIAASIAYQYVAESVGLGKLPDGPFKGRVRMIATGNDVVAMGKVVGGLTVQTYYPITPAADEALYMEGHRVVDVRDEFKEKIGLEKLGVVVVQTEDEISAINMAIGAALAGARAATTTSGPGFSLMNEAISMAYIMEAPVVITVWQRAGPSTGMATRTGQQDLLHALFAGHGDAVKIVLASGDHEEAFYDAIKALNWAEEFQIPVIHLLDKTLAASVKSFDEFDLDSVKIERGKLLYKHENGEYLRYKLTEDGISPRVPVGFAKQLVSSLEHTEYGVAIEDPEVRNAMVEKRLKKLKAIEAGIPEEERVKVYGSPSASVTIISWGSAKGPILDALEKLEADGISARYIHIKTFMPFPVKTIEEAFRGGGKIIVVDYNMLAQTSLAIRMFTGLRAPHIIQKFSGRALMEQEIVRAVKEIVESNVERVVVSDGA